MINVGEFAELYIVKLLSFGAYLDADTTEVLLPIREVPDHCKVGDRLKVFIYKDSENRLIASTRQPFIQLNGFASLEVMDTNKYGAFLDWGLDNQLLVPFREQHVQLAKGKFYVVRLYLDPKSDRLVATSRIERHLIDQAGDELKENDKVNLLVYGQSEIAFKVIINQKYSGLLYRSDLYQPVFYGESLDGYIKKIRPDQKIDLTLRMPGLDEYARTRQLLLDKLGENNGFLALSDDSSPDKIKNRLHISKKSFKKAVGGLYKEGLIALESSGIRLVQP